MAEKQTITLKSGGMLRKKKLLNLALNLLIAVLGASALFIKFFLEDGVIAFRAFTVDGNLFTTIVTFYAVAVNIRELKRGREHESRRFFLLMLCSAVTEAVIFIVVMLGYLPFVADTPQITPYDMFCLHVAIPILSVVRFVFFEKPAGVIKPAKLITGAIPIGVYGTGVVIAIKTGLLPVSFIPYSFLNFEDNFIWYFLFALVAIPAFGYLWAWLFYRVNMRVSALWYQKTDLAELEKNRVRALSRFDVVNSSILILFCMVSVFVLSFVMMINSRTSTAIQHELMSSLCYLLLDDYDQSYSNEPWSIRDGALYKGEEFITDGTSDEDYMNEDMLLYNTTVYMKASDMVPEAAQNYDLEDYVAVIHYSGAGGPAAKRGDVLEREIVEAIESSEDMDWYKEVKYDRELTAEELPYKNQLRNLKESYYRYVVAFGATFADAGVGIVEMYIPSSMLLEQAKNAEYNNDILMTVVVLAAFGALFIVVHRWIRALEKSVDFLKELARGEVPPKPLKLGRRKRTSGLERELNTLREKTARDG